MIVEVTMTWQVPCPHCGTPVIRASEPFDLNNKVGRLNTALALEIKFCHSCKLAMAYQPEYWACEFVFFSPTYGLL